MDAIYLYNAGGDLITDISSKALSDVETSKPNLWIKSLDFKMLRIIV